ncbi:MAG: neutral zinc metallopeptidase [Nocardioidaceae bacterium]|nr:neutral zinc metallopeptidase [Nocardioidaceae bacterium]
MKFNPKARLDTSQVRRRGGQRTSSGSPLPGGMGGGGFPMPGGAGGGIGSIILVIVIGLIATQCTGASNIPGLPGGDSDVSSAPDNASLEACLTGDDANNSQFCAIVGTVNSVQAYWVDALPDQTGQEYRQAQMQEFTGGTTTECGEASSAMGPFYCPADEYVYLELGFFDAMLEGQLGAEGGPFAEAYVVAHEYGHHVQNILGDLSNAQSGGSGPESGSVRVELQADCYAGLWANHATTVEDENGVVFISELTEADIQLAIDAASAVGDDRIQERTQGQVNKESWTHGSAEQRIRWFMTGYEKGDLASCDTFATATL